jgi:hypothetical protein
MEPLDGIHREIGRLVEAPQHIEVTDGQPDAAGKRFIWHRPPTAAGVMQNSDYFERVNQAFPV